MNIKEIKKQALEEFNEEKAKEAKSKIKSKLKELDRAEKVVANIKRELEDLEDELSQDN